MIGWSRSQIRSARLSHVTDLIACSLGCGIYLDMSSGQEFDRADEDEDEDEEF